jgi:gamma-glutamylputrescine oxidase
MTSRVGPVPRIYWHEQRPPGVARPAPLAHDVRTEVVVVGGGVAGLSCAQALSEQGRSVVVLEASTCGGGASGRSSGFITPDAEMELRDLVRSRGPESAKRLWDFAADGVDAIRQNIERNAIDCDLQVQDALFLASSQKGAGVVRDEHATRGQLGYRSTLYDAETIRSVLSMEGAFAGVRAAGTFGINAFAYCQGMRDTLRQSGVVIHERSPVTEVGEGQVQANGATVHAEVVVLCLDRFLPELGVLPQQVYHAQTFLAVSAPLTDAQLATMFPERRLMLWDTDLIYQYVRVLGDNRLLIGAASLLYTYAQAERPLAPRIARKMRAWLRSRFPQVNVELQFFWPGLIGVSKDFLPLAARDAEQPATCVVSGATGLPWAAALGRYMAEKIQSQRSDFDAEFDPRRRFPVGVVVQSLIGRPSAFALSHGIVKYFR